MKYIKLYFALVITLLLLGIGLGVYVWYTLQVLDTQIHEFPIEESHTRDSEEGESVTSAPVIPNAPTLVPYTTTVQLDTLPPHQKALLEVFGITDATVTITPQMYKCAEETLGADRILSIVEGSTPTPGEMWKLMACFKS